MTDQLPPRVVPSFGQRVIGAVKGAYDRITAPKEPQVLTNGAPVVDVPKPVADAFTVPFGPGLPPVSTQTDDRARFDDSYTGWNAIVIPRAEKPNTLSFSQMRDLIKGYHWTAIAVTRLMDALAAVEYDVVAVKPENDRKYRAEIDDMTERLKMPDGVTPWRTWYLKAFRDMIEIDAMVFNKVVSRGGDFLGLEVINGETIKIFVGDRGQPVGYGQVIGGQTRSTYKVDDPASIYNAIWGANEMLYSVRWPQTRTPYGNPPIERVAQAVQTAFNEESLRAAFFTDGTMPPGFLALAPNLSTKEVASIQRGFDNIFRGNQKLRVALQFLPGGRDVQYIPMKPNDWQNMAVADAYRRICIAPFGVNDAFLGITNTIHRSSSAQQTDVLDFQTIQPHAQYIADVVTKVIQAPSPHGWGHPYLKLQPRAASDKKTAEKVNEFAVAIEHEMITPEAAAQQVYPDMIADEEERGTQLPPTEYWPTPGKPKGGGAM